jgi:hypothetical protein
MRICPAAWDVFEGPPIEMHRYPWQSVQRILVDFTFNILAPCQHFPSVAWVSRSPVWQTVWFAHSSHIRRGSQIYLRVGWGFFGVGRGTRLGLRTLLSIECDIVPWRNCFKAGSKNLSIQSLAPKIIADRFWCSIVLPYLPSAIVATARRLLVFAQTTSQRRTMIIA